MSRLRSVPGLVKTALAAALLVTVAAACDEDGKSLPATCADPLPLDDIANAGVPAVTNPCVTPIGDAVSSVGPRGTTTTTAGTSTGGNASQGGADADADAGGS
jgi:hypothetical protein